MHYCSFCRRHLNGALTCPGCGASAPATRNAPRPGGRGPGITTAPDVGVPAGPRAAGVAPVEGTGDNAYAVPPGEGRAARRRQMARWRKRRRAAAGVSLAGVALVGGLLTVNVLPQTVPSGSDSAAAPVSNDPVDTSHSSTVSRPAPARPATPPAVHRTRHVSPQPDTATFKATPVPTTPRHHPAASGGSGTGSTPPRSTVPTSAPTSAPAPQPPPPSTGGGGTPQPTAAPSSPAPAPTGPGTTPTHSPKPVCVLVLCLG